MYTVKEIAAAMRAGRFHLLEPAFIKPRTERRAARIVYGPSRRPTDARLAQCAAFIDAEIAQQGCTI